MPDDEQSWTSVTTNPPQPGQYETRVKVGEDYQRTSLRYWDGHRWLSRNGGAGTLFGVPSASISQDWRVPTSGQEGLVHGGCVPSGEPAVPKDPI